MSQDHQSRERVLNQTVVQLSKKKLNLSDEDVRITVEALMVSDLSSATSFRYLLSSGALLQGNGLLSEETGQRMQNRVLEIFAQSRQGNPSLSVPKDSDPLAAPVVQINAKEDLTLGQLGLLLHDGQDRRFVKENLDNDILAYMYDQGSDPSKYTQGIISKMIFKILGKVSDPIDMANLMFNLQGFTWKDDGQPTNGCFEIYVKSKNEIKM